jgi:hypothetical protein
MLSSVVVAIGYAGPASADPLSVGARSAATVNSPSPERTLLAQASGDDTMARCQQLFALYDRHNSDGYARPLEARMALEDCRKGNVASGVAALKRVLGRAGIPVPPTESATAPGRSMSRWISPTASPPSLGLHVAMGTELPALSAKLDRNLRERRVAILQAVLDRP